MKKLFFISILLILFNGLTAQVTFYVISDAKEVVVGGTFTVSFVIENGNATQLIPPDFTNFRKLSGQSRSMETSIINGQRTSKVRYSYTLQGTKEGTFTIEPAFADIGNKTMSTDRLLIKVVKGADRKTEPGSVEESVIVKAELSSIEGYVGQQIFLDYKLYTKISLESYDIAFEPEYPGFYVENIRLYNVNQEQVVIDGEQYISKLMKRVALFPQQTGNYTINAATFRLGISTRNNSSFFFSTRTRSHNVTTEPIQIKVIPLPFGAPPSFSGAVGQFSVKASLSTNTVKTGEAVSLTLSVSGNGDVRKVTAPEIKVDSFLEVYEPKVVDENTSFRSGYLDATKRFEYLLLPKNEGIYSIIPEYSYLDPDSNAYISVIPDTFLLRAVGENVNLPETNINDIEDLSSSIMPLVSIHSLRPLNDSSSSIITLILFIFPVIILLIALFLKYIQYKKSLIDPRILARKKASKVAFDRLQKSKELMERKDVKQFFDEVSRSIYDYISDKIDIPPADLNKSNIEEKLSSRGVSFELNQSIQSILYQCEIALFGGGNPVDKMPSIYEDSIQAILGLEENI